LVGVAGCGVKKVPARGTVTLDGKPMSSGVIEFVPDTSKGNNLRVAVTSAISSDGHFDVMTAGMDRADNGKGAPVGWFKVKYFHPNEGGATADSTIPKVAKRFRSEDTTPISIELTDPPPADGYTIELMSK